MSSTDKKFVFQWKDSVLEFTYSEEGGNKLKKTFDFSEKKDVVLDTITLSGPPPLTPTGTALALVPVSSFSLAPVEAVEEKKTLDVVLNAHSDSVPTVKVSLPEEMPQIVSVRAEALTTAVVLKDEAPQIYLDVVDASIIVPENSELFLIKTPMGSSDIVVAIPEETKELADSAGISVLEEVKKAIAETEHHPELPDLEPTIIDPTIPPADVIPQIIGIVVEGDIVHISNVSEKVPEDSKLIVVETPPEMPNIIAAIDKKTEKDFADRKLDPSEEISKFLKNTETEIASVLPLSEEEVADAFDYDEGLFEYPEGRYRWWRRRSEFPS